MTSFSNALLNKSILHFCIANIALLSKSLGFEKNTWTFRRKCIEIPLWGLENKPKSSMKLINQISSCKGIEQNTSVKGVSWKVSRQKIQSTTTISYVLLMKLTTDDVSWDYLLRAPHNYQINSPLNSDFGDIEVKAG